MNNTVEKIYKSESHLQKYEILLRDAIKYYYNDDLYYKYFDKYPLMRDSTFKYCLKEFEKMNGKIMVELGTTRSFVDGRFEGCNSDDPKYWDEDDYNKWDWSAGCFTMLFSECLKHHDFKLHTVDLMKNHIDRNKIMTKNYKNIVHHVASSEDFLNNYDINQGKLDLIYLDTGDMTPIENTAQLQLREAKIIVERDLLNDNGILLIDDVRNLTPKLHGEESNYGKAKYSIPYLLDNGFQLIMDEYQVVLRKI